MTIHLRTVFFAFAALAVGLVPVLASSPNLFV